jgi:Fur family transcriptional regulator, peroxide stress response regulator
MADPQERYEQLVARLQEHSCRLTPQRIALLRLLAESQEHPSAAHLYRQLKERFPTTSAATVYKTLALLKELGEVLELGFSDDDNRYDGRRPHPHPHLICVRCHQITDPEVTLMEALDQQMTEVSGYQIVGHRLDWYGICPDCRRQSGGESRALPSNP